MNKKTLKSKHPGDKANGVKIKEVYNENFLYEITKLSHYIEIYNFIAMVHIINLFSIGYRIPWVYTLSDKQHKRAILPINKKQRRQPKINSSRYNYM